MEREEPNEDGGGGKEKGEEIFHNGEKEGEVLKERERGRGRARVS